jgi:homoserine dehydrogenase
MRMHEGGYYIRLAVYDRSGAFAEIAQIMADEGISLESIVQRDRTRTHTEAETHGDAPQPVILTTYETTEAAVKRALGTITARNVVAGTPQMIRIEKLR